MLAPSKWNFFFCCRGLWLVVECELQLNSEATIIGQQMLHNS